MPNLAGLRYRRAMEEWGGPIRRIELADITIAGERQFLANAYLRPDLLGPVPARQLFSNANATGTDVSPMVARFKAISEALERWAHWTVARSPERARFGFDRDSSSTGMAAFPGLWAREARAAALREAVERFNLLSWWEGYLPALEVDSGQPGVGAAVITSEAPGLAVIVFRRSPEGHFAYGHAAGTDFGATVRQALGELERHDWVLRVHALATIGAPCEVGAFTDVLEQRSWFFSTAQGHELFLDRLRSGARRSARAPQVVFDGPIPGPWTRYADVWRTVFAPPSERFLSKDPTYFFW